MGVMLCKFLSTVISVALKEGGNTRNDVSNKNIVKQPSVCVCESFLIISNIFFRVESCFYIKSFQLCELCLFVPDLRYAAHLFCPNLAGDFPRCIVS